jgi:hypothetical protein
MAGIGFGVKEEHMLGVKYAAFLPMNVQQFHEKILINGMNETTAALQTPSCGLFHAEGMKFHGIRA